MIASKLIRLAKTRVRRGLTIDSPSFVSESALYLVGEPDAVEGHARLRSETRSYADGLLVEVAQAFALRRDRARREDGEVELRAALVEARAVIDAWVDAIDHRADQGTRSTNS